MTILGYLLGVPCKFSRGHGNRGPTILGSTSDLRVLTRACNLKVGFARVFMGLRYL